jgi:5-formyltetrahydrofolate cyclo-ligase
MEHPASFDYTDQKRILRRLARSRRAALSATEREAATHAINQRLQTMFSGVQWSADALVAVYLAKGDEANIDECARWLLEAGVHVVAPRGGGEHMPFYSLDPEWNHLVVGEFGVRQPAIWNGGRAVDPEAVSIVLVPGLAFDLGGNRLGQGAGWYDKVLSRAPQALKIGIAFEAQILPQVPHEAHDLAMDGWVTESRLVDVADRIQSTLSEDYGSQQIAASGVGH